VITHIAESLSGLQADTFHEVATSLVEKIKAHPVAFDEADFIVRDKLFSYYIDCQEFSDAAVVLAGVNVESTNRIFTDEEKADLYVKIAEAFLEDDQTAEAELYVNKASSFINTVNNWALVLRYKVTYARVLDANRKFIDAAMRYYELSQTQQQDVVQDDLLVVSLDSCTAIFLHELCSKPAAFRSCCPKR
jgi:COP9 signalosome complex subunit 4